ncbi:MAG: hypothetical protein JSW71_05135 [Gemmatimonadota bacterium]|nr:MAG: hypothetical protein JSW71_05135 [Gemmatimonadota bacterium]
MIARQTLVRWLWRIPVCVAVLFAGQTLAVPLISALGLELPPAPLPVEEGIQSLLFLLAAIAIAAALAGMAVGLAGRWWERGTILAAFIYVVYGIGNAIEASIFTTLGGEVALAVMHLPPSVLGGLAVALLFAAPSDQGFTERAAAFFSGWKPGKLAARLGLAVLAFPLCYFLFGVMVSPIVMPHYARLDFLVTPPLPTLLIVVFTRSVLLLLVSLPVIVAWQESRGRLIIALGIGHFVAVGLAGLIQATFFPAVIRWAHGIEILADSLCYAAALAWLFFPRRSRAGEEQPVLRERLA